MRRTALSLTIALASVQPWLTAAQAQTVKVCLSLAAPGCSCTASAVNIGYGSVAVDQIGGNRDASGSISISCSASGQTSISVLDVILLNIPYEISLGPSSNRQLRNGSYAIPYKIYQNAGRSVEWGTAAEGKQMAGTLSITAVAVSLGIVNLNFGLTSVTKIPYTRLFPSGGGLGSGLYSDNVTVTVTY